MTNTTATAPSTVPCDTNNLVDRVKALLGAIEGVQTAMLHQLERLERL